MELKPHLSRAWLGLKADLPFCDNVAVVVGNTVGKEAIKDIFLSKASNNILPGGAVLSLAELARNIILAFQEQLPQFLRPIDQIDALQVMASKVKGEPWAVYFKNRKYAQKVAEFISAIDRHANNIEEREALLDAAAHQNPHLTPVYKLLSVLWQAGQLTPWSDAELFRHAAELLQNATQPPSKLPKELWLYQTEGLSPVERLFITTLNTHFKVMTDETSYTPAPLQPTTVQIWQPHSVWDEVHAVKEELIKLNTVPGSKVFSKTAVFVPQHPAYKRLVRDVLMAANIPLRDPSLSKAWVDKPQWIWWRDALRAISLGLNRDHIIALLGPGKSNEDHQARVKFVELTAKKGISGRLKDIEAVSKELDLPVLHALILITKKLSKAFTPTVLHKELTTLVAQLQPFSEHGAVPSPQLLMEFAESLLTREYLLNTKFRLPKLIPLFEEYLETRSLEQSLRAPDGVWFLSHGVTTPVHLDYAFVLGAHTIAPTSIASDQLDLENAVTASKDSSESNRAHVLWQVLNSEYDPHRRREERINNHRRALGFIDAITVSFPTYDLGASPTVKSHWVKNILGEECYNAAVVTFQGAHAGVNWSKGLDFNTTAPQVVDATAADVLKQSKKLRVSAFEDYLACPFLYYARHELKLDRELEIGVDAKPQDKGTLLHKVAERVLRQEIAQGHLPTNTDVKEILNHELKTRSLQGMYRAPLLKHKFSNQLLGLLNTWLSHEQARRADYPTLKPWLLEENIEFKLLPELTLVGRIDRIDLDKENNVFVLIDYKTGTPSFNGKEVKEGQGVQLLSYSMSIAHTHNVNLAAAFYMELKPKILESTGVFFKQYGGTHHKATGRSGGFVKEGGFSDLMPPVIEHWQKAAQSLLAGDFSPKPAKADLCKRCLFKYTCGYPIHASQDDANE